MRDVLAKMREVSQNDCETVDTYAILAKLNTEKTRTFVNKIGSLSNFIDKCPPIANLAVTRVGGQLLQQCIGSGSP